MVRSERGIVFTNDLDGVHFKNLPSLRAVLRLLRKDASLPEIGRPIGEYVLPQGLRGIIVSRWSILYHQLRPVNREALEGLAEFKKAAEENQRQLRIAALSGRESDKHPMTQERLQQLGYMEYFSEVFLNQGKSSTAWKELVIRRLLGEGLNVAHIDDDLRSGLYIARINDDYPNEQRILVYVLRNLSNHPKLLKRAGIVIPDNLVLVRSFPEAAVDFAKRLREGKV